MEKSNTRKIVVFEPDAEELKMALAGRQLTPGLGDFLKNLLKTKKWTRKINIPSGHDDVAAVLVFTTALKEAGLEISSELHVFHAGEVIVEKWEAVGGGGQNSPLPLEAFLAIDVRKVRAEDGRVTIEFSAPAEGSHNRTLVKIFDFNLDAPAVRLVPHPLLDRESHFQL